MRKFHNYYFKLKELVTLHRKLKFGNTPQISSGFQKN